MNINQSIQKFIHNGISFAENESDQNQIITTNYLSILVVIICIVGSTLSYIDKYTIAFYSYLGFFFVQFIVFYLQHTGKNLISKLILSFLPQLFLVVPLYFSKNASQLYVDHFHVLVAVSIIPLLLFQSKKESHYLTCGILYSLMFVLIYDTVFGFNSSPNVKFETLNSEFIRFKLRQLMFYGIVVGGYLVKIRLSQHFEAKLNENNSKLLEKNIQIKEIADAIQAQNEEMHSQQEEMRSQNEELQNQQAEIIRINSQTSAYTEVLMELTKSKSLKKGDLQSNVAEICKRASDASGAEKLSVWEYDRRINSIKCKNLYDATLNSHIGGIELTARNFPDFFEVLHKEQIIVANNAFENKATNCLTYSYLSSSQISAILISPYFVNGDLFGVVFFETLKPNHNWSLEDIAFIKSLADLVSLSYESAERKKAEDRIRIQKEEIISKNVELQAQQDKIKAINENLEKRILERTSLLDKKNSQLQEYTYVNSHLLRGPLCRILGIIYLLENDLIQDNSVDFLVHLKESASELDDMVKKITRNLEKEHPISAEDILIHSNESFVQ